MQRYRQLALQYHPDKNSSDLETAHQQFTRIGAAHEAICFKSSIGHTQRNQPLHGTIDKDRFSSSSTCPGIRNVNHVRAT